MNERRDPARWSETGSSAPPEMNEWLNAARRDLPGPESLAALGIALPPLPLAPTGTEGAALGLKAKSAAVASKATFSLTAGKLVLAGVVAATIGTGIFLAYPDAPTPPGGDAPRSGVVTAKDENRPPHDGTSGEEASELVEELPLATSADEAERQDSEPARDEPPVPFVEEHTEDGSSRGSAVPQTNPSKAESELDLLHRARRALGTDPARALALSRSHEARFPKSKYVQEREVIRIRALRALGREAEAERQSESFDKRFPDSAHRH